VGQITEKPEKQIMRANRIPVAILFPLIVILFLSNHAIAQNARTTRMWPQLPLMEEGKSVSEMIDGKQPFNQAVFDRFFNDIFPLFAQSDDIKNLAKLRVAFKANYLAKARNPMVKQHLNEITLKKMDEIANGNFPQCCRANAMMIIFDLNEVESTPRGSPVKQ
jgi:hypothetical protein